MSTIDILVPTYRRPTALAVTLTSLVAQSCQDFRVIVSDQTEESNPLEAEEVQAVLRLLSAQGHEVKTHKHLPRRGIAEHRQFLLEQVTAPYALFLDDDLILTTTVVEQLLRAIQEEQCGFVGSAVIGLSFLDDVRPQEQAIEFWDEPVQPELIRPKTRAWERWRLHNAANIYHIQQKLGLTPDNQRKYRVAWVGGCVMYDTQKIHSIEGFSFWEDLPEQHCGEDVLVQLRMMAKYGGCGIVPSGVYHQELQTTIVDRGTPADNLFDWAPEKQLVGK